MTRRGSFRVFLYEREAGTTCDKGLLAANVKTIARDNCIKDVINYCTQELKCHGANLNTNRPLCHWVSIGLHANELIINRLRFPITLY